MYSYVASEPVTLSFSRAESKSSQCRRQTSVKVDVSMRRKDGGIINWGIECSPCRLDPALLYLQPATATQAHRSVGRSGVQSAECRVQSAECRVG